MHLHSNCIVSFLCKGGDLFINCITSLIVFSHAQSVFVDVRGNYKTCKLFLTLFKWSRKTETFLHEIHFSNWLGKKKSSSLSSQQTEQSRKAIIPTWWSGIVSIHNRVGAESQSSAADDTMNVTMRITSQMIATRFNQLHRSMGLKSLLSW